MDLLRTVIIWCDVSFETETSYQAMQDQFNETTTSRLAAQTRPDDPIDWLIFAEGQEELRSNSVPLIVVRTADDAKREMRTHQNEKIFVICSGSLGRYLVPEIAREYPWVHKVYIYAHNLLLHMDWVNKHLEMVRPFDFHTELLVRLTRDISKHFIERGQMLLTLGAANNALMCFRHAEQLENAANKRAKMAVNPHDPTTYGAQPDFRAHLDLLQGQAGLIARATEAAWNPGESSSMSESVSIAPDHSFS